ncbi:MAG: glycosyl transferase [Opitutales bacterium]|nr:glycosyl transferase [Opitutales bacterium]
MPEHVNILCLKWGKLYPAEYVNKLYAGVARNLKRPFRFFCCTDNPEGLDPRIETIPFPQNPGIKRAWPDILVKLELTRPGFGDLQGPTLFMDLDIVIMEALDPFFDFEPGRFCIIHNWVNWRKKLIGQRPPVGNSSVFRFNAGTESDHIYQTFLKEMHRAEDSSQFNTEQAFLTYAAKNVVWWPDEWVRSFKWNCRPKFPLNLFCAPKPPKKCRILVFHGKPNPDEAILGYRGKKIHHHSKAAPWISEHWKT